MTPRTLRDAADAADGARFAGRAAELRIVRDLLDDGSPSRVLFVHGPGGIGKSALLRAAGRLAEEAGFVVAHFDGRALSDDLESLAARMRSVQGSPSCIVIDEVDELGSRLRPLRDRLLEDLSDSARAIFAGRRGPDRSWRENGIDAIVTDLELRPLSDEDSGVILTRRGVEAARVPGIVAWAQGSPLALTVAASSFVGGPDLHGPVGLEERLTAWLAGRPILDVSRDVLEVAALARTVDARLLAAALPGRATRDGLRELAALPVVERVGDAFVLHAVLAASIRARLRATEPRREAELIRRIAEHLATRARLGDMGALLRLSQLIESPELRRAIGNDPSDTYYSDSAGVGEFAEFGRAHGFDRGPDWLELLAWVERWPDGVLLMRHIEGRAIMFCCFVPVGMRTPPGAITSGLRAAVERVGADPDRSVAGVVLFADASPEDIAESARLGTGAFMRQRGADMQTMLIHYPTPDRRPQLPSAIAVEVPGDLPRPVAVSDFRPHGAVGTVESMVLSEHGFAARDLDIDRTALLAEDDDPERIARLTRALDEVFGSSPAEQRLRRAIELVHLGARRSEEECLEALYVSRPTWYRLLRTARERVLAPR